ncbi:MAG TPA: VOC family protein [Acidobacteria bacterium]|jgi:catechol 2,3-dioxygenase-like lactoylglutathione lyase family enzyme|nr:VOC family protein [Acidobacteriota bacterium]
MNRTPIVLALVAAVATLVAIPAIARAADYHHVHITASAPSEGVRWYEQHMDCEPVADRSDAADCAGVELVFVVQPAIGSTQGTGVNHIGFSYPDLTAKMAELEAVGVRGSGVRLQRFPDGSTLRDVPGLFKLGFVFDPWGTRIEMVEDPERLGFHHIHLSATDPAATLAWYQDVFGGETASLKGRLDGLLFDDVWVLVSEAESIPATTQGRAIDHIGFSVPDLDAAAAEMRRKGIVFQTEPEVPEGGRTSAKRAFIVGPDNVRLAVVETGWAGVVTARAEVVATDLEPYTVPRTPWGEPDLQGVWTGNSAHSIPLERPVAAAEVDALTPEEAEARRERGTLGSIWGYEREWRDTTLGYVKTAPSTQVAMVVDPPDGRIPPLTAAAAQARAEAAGRGRGGSRTPYPNEGPEDLPNFVRCITRGLPGMMMPGIYNNGLQIVQGPGHVAVQKEMIHETRVIPTEPRPALGPNLTSWLGTAQGRWDGDTLVVETTNFNGRAPYRGSGENLTLVERFTRLGPTTLEYQFTIDDPTVWTRPWTGMFRFDKDDDQYELVEYACHEGNYGMTNILSGSRAIEQQAVEQGR